MRLNLGCGNRKFAGWTNVDSMAACEPDEVVDLERFPWPWADNSAGEILLSHVLEHLGAATQTYLGIVKELYRVCRDGALVTIIVPHPRHDTFLGDPTHVRAITPHALALFSQQRNREWIEKGVANTPLGLYLGVDFTIENVNYELDELWRRRVSAGEVSQEDLHYAERTYNNVITQMTITMRTYKPHAGEPQEPDR